MTDKNKAPTHDNNVAAYLSDILKPTLQPNTHDDHAAILADQAIALDMMFYKVMEHKKGHDGLQSYVYALAMKAQNQCRQTLLARNQLTKGGKNKNVKK